MIAAVYARKAPTRTACQMPRGQSPAKSIMQRSTRQGRAGRWPTRTSTSTTGSAGPNSPSVRAFCAFVPVMGHIGMTPQSVNQLGGFGYRDGATLTR